VRRHKESYLIRRLQKLDKNEGKKSLKKKMHQQAKNIIKQNSTSIFARTLVSWHSKKALQHLSL
jgi:hypothetical protein